MRKTTIVADASLTNARIGCRLGKIAPWKNGARNTNSRHTPSRRYRCCNGPKRTRCVQLFAIKLACTGLERHSGVWNYGR
jgi:hypothetical protein